MGTRTLTQVLNAGILSPIDAVAGPASKRKANSISGIRAKCPRLPRERLIMTAALGCIFKIPELADGELEDATAELSRKLEPGQVHNPCSLPYRSGGASRPAPENPN